VRGVVRISLGLSALDQEVARARDRQLLVAGVTILGLAASMVVFLGRVVLAPIARVAGAARRIGEGDLAARAGVRSADEIGQLGRTIDDMAGHLQAARSELETRNSELASALESLRESSRKLELLEQLKGELSKFVPEAVTRLLEQRPDARELEKRETDVSVLFLDVEGYTRLSEQLPPPRLNRMIQEYFSAFLEIIRAHHGDVNETAGDGLMVIFQSEGSPTRHAQNAAGAAFRLLTRVAQLNEELTGTYPPVAIHVGINSGPALVGSARPSSRPPEAGAGPLRPRARPRISPRGSPGSPGAARSRSAPRPRPGSGTTTSSRTWANVAQPVRVYRLVPAGIYARVGVRDGAHGDAVAAHGARRQGDRRVGDHRLDAGDRERGAGRPRAPRRAGPRHPAHGRRRLAGHPVRARPRLDRSRGRPPRPPARGRLSGGRPRSPAAPAARRGTRRTSPS
jgi:HAMP domain-containing protein